MKRRMIIDLITDVEDNEPPSLLYEDIQQELLCCWHDVSFTMKHEDVAEQTEPTISKMEQVDEPERNMAEDIVESFGFKAESYRQAKAKDEPQTCSFSDCDNFKNPDYERCIECKRKQIKLKTEQTERSE